MKNTKLNLSATKLISYVLIATGGLGVSLPAYAADSAPLKPFCDEAALKKTSFSGVSINSAAIVGSGEFSRPELKASLTQLPVFCRIAATVETSPTSYVNFEVWVPEQRAWNQKLVVTGNGGYSANLKYQDMAYALRHGYAVAGGDTGHQDDKDMSWGVQNPESIMDWGTRSIHAITGPAKSMVSALMSASVKRSYFYGCSTGGHQGYAEMQVYPEDFDGIIAGAPGNNRTRLNVEFLHRFLSNRYPGMDDKTILTPDKTALLTEKALEACDALDGVKDGVINDPRQCTTERFNITSLLCKTSDTDQCLTALEIEAAKKIYEGPKNPRTGEQIYPGQLVGTETEWPGYWGKTAPVRSDFWRLWVFDDKNWDWWTFDYDQDLTLAESKLGKLVDHTNPDINRFKNRGGKAIVFHGWNDAVVNALDTIEYYENVREAQGGQEQTDTFFRLFMVPGMAHCSGGTGPTVFGNAGVAAPNPDANNDLLMALDRWVEEGVAPEKIIASQAGDESTKKTQRLCPYPKKARYDGKGEIGQAESFVCQ